MAEDSAAEKDVVAAVLNPPSPGLELKRAPPVGEGPQNYEEEDYEEDLARRAERHEGSFDVAVVEYRKEPEDHATRYMEREVLVGAAMGRTIFFECEEKAAKPREEKQTRNLARFFGGTRTTNLADDNFWDGTIHIWIKGNVKIRRMVIKVVNFDNPGDAISFIQRAHYRMCMKDLFTERKRLMESSQNVTTEFLCYPVAIAKLKMMVPILTMDPDDGTGCQTYGIDIKIQDLVDVNRSIHSVIIRDMDTICQLPWVACRDCARGVGHIITVFCSMRVSELEPLDQAPWIDEK